MCGQGRTAGVGEDCRLRQRSKSFYLAEHEQFTVGRRLGSCPFHLLYGHDSHYNRFVCLFVITWVEIFSRSFSFNYKNANRKTSKFSRFADSAIIITLEEDS